MTHKFKFGDKVQHQEDGCEQESFTDIRELIDFLTKLRAAPCNHKLLSDS